MSEPKPGSVVTQLEKVGNRQPGHNQWVVQNREEIKKEFLKHFSQSGNVWASAQLVGITRKTVYLWRNEDPQFREDMAMAYEDAADTLEAEGMRRARNGSDTMLIFMLKGMRPEKFSERHDYFVSQRYKGKTTEELRYLLAERLGAVESSGAGGVTAPDGLPGDDEG